MRALAAGVPLVTGPQVGLPGNLEAIVQIVDGVKDLVFVLDLLDGVIREGLLDPALELVPFGAAVEVVGHEEAAAQAVLAQQLALFIAKTPFANLDGV